MKESNIPVPIIEETEEYKDFVGMKDVNQLPSSLDEFMGIEKDINIDNLTKKKEKSPHYKHIRCHFNTEKDYIELANLLKLHLNKKTQYLIYEKPSTIFEELFS